MKEPILGITLGDVNGIGPEIIFASLRRRPVPAGRARFAVIGDDAVIANAARNAGMRLPPSWAPGRPWPGKTSVVCWDPAPSEKRPLPVRPGRVTPAAGRAAGQALCAAAAAACEGVIAGIVTAPVCKESLHRAGYTVPGQTEWLAEISGTRRFGMLLVGGSLRVILVTRHVPLAAVAQAVTRRAVTEATELMAMALQWMQIPNQRIGVCALNPHAGDGGIHGDEDQRVIRPAVRGLQRKGIHAEGPIPADAVFHMAKSGRFGGIVAMYHDQGLAPLKLHAFSEGVNVTLGLPFVRTSPDHGTAFDIAGKNQADHRSMTAAIRLAVELAQRPKPWPSHGRRRIPANTEANHGPR